MDDTYYTSEQISQQPTAPPQRQLLGWAWAGASSAHADMAEISQPPAPQARPACPPEPTSTQDEADRPDPDDLEEDPPAPAPWRAARDQWYGLHAHSLRRPAEPRPCRARVVAYARVPDARHPTLVWWGASGECACPRCRRKVPEGHVLDARQRLEPMGSPGVMTVVLTTPPESRVRIPHARCGTDLRRAAQEAVLTAAREVLGMGSRDNIDGVATSHPAGENEVEYSPHVNVILPLTGEVARLGADPALAERFRDRLKAEWHARLAEMCGLSIAAGEIRRPWTYVYVWHNYADVLRVLERELRGFPGWRAAKLRVVYFGRWRNAKVRKRKALGRAPRKAFPAERLVGDQLRPDEVDYQRSMGIDLQWNGPIRRRRCEISAISACADEAQPSAPEPLGGPPAPGEWVWTVPDLADTEYWVPFPPRGEEEVHRADNIIANRLAALEKPTDVSLDLAREMQARVAAAPSAWWPGRWLARRLRGEPVGPAPRGICALLSVLEARAAVAPALMEDAA